MILLLLACHALAGWTPLRTTTGGVDYIDTNTVVPERHLRRVLTLTDLAHPDKDGDRSYRTLLEIDCKNTIYRSLASFFFAGPMASGAGTGRTDIPSPWRQVQADSATAAAMTLVCAAPREGS